MSQRIHLGALVIRDGRLLLVRPRVDSAWELPGGPLLPEHPDTEAAMDQFLASLGISAPAIDEDFLDTLFFVEDDGQLVFNIYAPTDWSGEPTAHPGTGLGWFAPEELPSIRMDERIRHAVLAALGLIEPIADDARVLEAMSQALGGQPGQPDQAAGPPAHAMAETFEAVEQRWSNPDLDPRTRALIAVALTAVAGRAAATTHAAQAAVSSGATRAEIAETIRMVGLYAGYPAASEAWLHVEPLLGPGGGGAAR